MRKYVLSSLAALSAIAVGAMPAMAEPGFVPSGLLDTDWVRIGGTSCVSSGLTIREVGVQIEPSNDTDLAGLAGRRTVATRIGSTTFNGVRYAQAMFSVESGSTKLYFVGWVPFYSVDWEAPDCG